MHRMYKFLVLFLLLSSLFVLCATAAELPEPTKDCATVLFYQSPIDARTTPVAKHLYKSGEKLDAITPEGYTDPESGKRLEPSGKWLVYDSTGVLISEDLSTIRASHLGKVYILCPEYLSSSVVLTSISKDGKVEHHESTGILSKIPRGTTVILRQDLPCPTSFYGTAYKVDLNGYTVYTLDGAKQEIFRGMESLYVYSSRPGARVFTGSYMKNGSTDASGNPVYTNQAAFIVSDAGSADGTKFMLGYMNDTDPSPYPIDMFCGAFSQMANFHRTSVYLRNLNIVASAGDNKGIFTTRNEKNNRYWQIDDCEILITNNKALCSNVKTNKSVGTYVFNNTNIYGNGSLFGVEGAQTVDCYITLNDTNIYGTHNINAGACTYEDSNGKVYNYTRYLKILGNCHLSDLQCGGLILPDGYMFIPKVTVGSSGLFLFPNNARYCNFELGNYSYVGGSYSSRGYIGKIENFTSALLQSVAIDTSVNVLIYIPVSNSIEGIYLDETNLYNPNDTKVVAGNDYAVVRVGIPPKEAYRAHTVTIRFYATDVTIPLDASLLSYAKKLASVSDTPSSGTYYRDSNALMRYVLYYVKTASTTIGSATSSDLAELDSLLGSFALTASDKTITETVYSTSSVSGKLTAATLNLDTKVGMVFEVAKGFVGTVRVDMPHSTSIVKTYTTSSPAGSEEYIVLANIPAYALRENVTVTITPSSGSVTTFTFNLATYVNGTKSTISYAVYAYAKAASTYHAKYPTASVYGE